MLTDALRSSIASTPPRTDELVGLGVQLPSEMDRLRLAWLIAEVGMPKVQSSITKWQTNKPSSPLYVSDLLGWYRRRVPTEIFAPALFKRPVVYLLRSKAEETFKIGESSEWLMRAFMLVRSPDYVADVFDPERSLAFGLGSKDEAKHLETACKQATSHLRPKDAMTRPSPTEWRLSAAFDQVLAIIRSQLPDARSWTLQQELQEAKHLYAASFQLGPAS
jgi:hypothetical protein